MIRPLFPLVMLTAFGLAACSPQPAEQGVAESAGGTSSEAPSVEAANAIAALLGEWPGVEGTYLIITPTPDGYAVEIADLDGPRTFQGRADGDAIVIERDGLPLRIRKGTGEQTGMKWLADSQDCVVVDANEGYCRD